MPACEVRGAPGRCGGLARRPGGRAQVGAQLPSWVFSQAAPGLGQAEQLAVGRAAPEEAGGKGSQGHLWSQWGGARAGSECKVFVTETVS